MVPIIKIEASDSLPDPEYVLPLHRSLTVYPEGAQSRTPNVVDPCKLTLQCGISVLFQDCTISLFAESEDAYRKGAYWWINLLVYLLTADFGDNGHPFRSMLATHRSAATLGLGTMWKWSV